MKDFRGQDTTYDVIKGRGVTKFSYRQDNLLVSASRCLYAPFHLGKKRKGEGVDFEVGMR